MTEEGLRWRGNEITRIVLGTAQLGMHYGIANIRGKPMEAEALQIVDAAWKHGMRFFDTAQAYGDSEAALGRALRYLGIAKGANVISKISPRLDPSDSNRILHSIEESQQVLGVPNLWGMLLHRAEWLDLWDRGVGEALRKSQERGIVRYVGASVYTVEEARRVLEHPEIDLIQVPCNAWDQRMKTAGILQLAKRSGKLCFIRSIYLQGLLTMPPNRIAERLPHARLAAERWHEICAEYGVGPVELAMRFALSLQCPLIVGVESEEQVLATYRLVSQPPIPDNIAEEIRSLMEPLVSDDIIDPRKWNLQC